MVALSTFFLAFSKVMKKFANLQESLEATCCNPDELFIFKYFTNISKYFDEALLPLFFFELLQK